MGTFLAISLLVSFGLTLIFFLLIAVFDDSDILLAITIILAIITVVLFIALGIFAILDESQFYY
ncbi:hypothetical protein UFVDC4_00156 [Staphylococcus phage vB_SauM-UFV_DC4]|nr:hypothetical protein UFVDC4_00156 [Staphylococcus phage vB_SauM-UFV_DC4]